MNIPPNKTKTPNLAQDALILDLRASIDHLDTSFLNLLTERMRVVRKIMFIKKQKNLDPGRSEARQADMKKLIEMSVQVNLKSVFFEKILHHVFEDAQESYQNDIKDPVAEVLEKTCRDVTLEDLRSTLLNLDRSICLVLSERFKVVKRIGRYKHQLGIPPLDPTRWEQVLKHKVEMADRLGVNANLITDIFNSIHEVALQIEDEIAS